MKRYEVSTKPSDTITDLTLHQDLLVSSWDGNLYKYNPTNGELMSMYTHGVPITKVLIQDKFVFSDVQGQINWTSLDLTHSHALSTTLIGIHTLELYNNSIIACGWTKQLGIITENSVDYIDISFKPQSSCLNGNKLALVDGETVQVIDLKNYKVCYSKKVSEQIRCVMIEDNLMYIGTYGGKLRLVNTLTSEESVVNAHKKIQGNKKIGYPVNQISNYGDVYTCGSDGTINTFSFKEKITQKVIQSFEYGVLKFAKYGSLFVACCGYNYELGEGDTSNNPIYIFNG